MVQACFRGVGEREQSDAATLLIPSLESWQDHGLVNLTFSLIKHAGGYQASPGTAGSELGLEDSKNYSLYPDKQAVQVLFWSFTSKCNQKAVQHISSKKSLKKAKKEDMFKIENHLTKTIRLGYLHTFLGIVCLLFRLVFTDLALLAGSV